MADLNILPLYTDAYLADTLHLSTEEHGAYLLLLISMWRAGGKLRNDPELLQRITRVPRNRWKRTWEAIEPFFMKDDAIVSGGDDAIVAPSFIVQKRLADVFATSLSRKETAAANGARGGRPSKSLKTNGVAKATGSDPVKLNGTGHISEMEPTAKPNPNPGGNRIESQTTTGSKALLQVHSTSTEKNLTTTTSEQGAARAHEGTAAGVLVTEGIRAAQSEYDAILNACNDAMPKEATWTVRQRMDVSAILGLVHEGASLELDVVPAIRAEAARLLSTPPEGFEGVGNWNYFARCARRHWERRLKAGKEPVASTPLASVLTPEQMAAAWDKRLQEYRTYPSGWEWTVHGPPPTEHDCRAGRALCNKHGFYTEAEQRALVERFIASEEEDWPREAGPNPKERGCRILARIVNQYPQYRVVLIQPQPQPADEEEQADAAN